MCYNGSANVGCLVSSDGVCNNGSCTKREVSVTSTAISMTVGIVSNTLALFILIKAYRRFRFKSKAAFLLFASGLVVTDFLGHLINGSLALYVYASQKDWETYHKSLCDFFGVCMAFFGLTPLLLGSLMAVERCVGVTRPLLHTTALGSHHVKSLLGLTWLLGLLVALLPILFQRSYQVQRSRSWCFFRLQGPRDWVDVLLPIFFSVLGLLSLLLSLVCNTMTFLTLLRSRVQLDRDHHRHCRNTSHHSEMVCQLLAIMLVSCVCWGPILITAIIFSLQDHGEDQASYTHMLLVVRMATWNQILDPWVYILLRKSVLRRLFLLALRLCSPHLKFKLQWQGSTQESSTIEARSSVISRPDFICLDGPFLPDTAIQSAHLP